MVTHPSPLDLPPRTLEDLRHLPPPKQARVVSFHIAQAILVIRGLIGSGRLRPGVEAIFPLPQAREAFEMALQGHTRGKIVLQVV